MSEPADPTEAAHAADAVAARVGFCAILGLPNVGTSTLLNTVLGMRIAAVSQKPQTTRNRILGVKNLPPSDDLCEAQIVFFDTPGAQRGQSALRRYMRDEALAAAGECDVALVMIDAADPAQRSPEALRGSEAGASLEEALAPVQAPALLAINKIDRLPEKKLLLPIIEAFHALGRYQEIVPISARDADGIDSLLTAIARRLAVGPKLYPETMVTDRAERFLAGEFVREQLFHQLGEELPYATAVVVESFEERPERGDVVIAAVVFVERDSQKAIVVGKGGARIKEVGQRARQSIAGLLGCPVHLTLHVKVAKNWSREPRGIRDMGYE
jgi:GTP-binding protein Era